MNIFALHEYPQLAAQAHADKHVHKMIVESTQMLCTAAHIHGISTPNIYKPTHPKHPCTIWLIESAHNRAWLYEMVRYLSNQRSGPLHKSIPVFDAVYAMFMPHGDYMLHTPFAQAMPPTLKGPNGVEAYQRYYRWKKANGLKLEYVSPSIIKRNPPIWL